MQEFVIAIPSYKRADNQRTLKYLSEIGVPKDRIYIFVQTKEDREAYRKYEDKCNIMFAKADGGAAARNNILNGLVDKYNVIMLDDDVRKIGILDGKDIRPIETAAELDAVFSKCFNQAKKIGTKMFGVYPVYNAFFMSRTISTRVAVNTVFGFAKGFGLRYDENYDTKEDAALCGQLLSLRGKILRFNFLAVDADHRKNKNGYIDKWHQEENIRCVKQLCFNYPQIFTPQNGAPWEVRLLIKDEKINLEASATKKKK